MTNEFTKAATITGAFLKWFEMALEEMEKAVNTSGLSFWKRWKANKHLKRLKTLNKKCKRDFTEVIRTLEEIKDHKDADKYATDVYKMVHRTFAKVQFEYQSISKIINVIKFSKGEINA